MQLFITLDYELFLLEPGENVEYSLIAPTKRLHDILDRWNARAAFFVDAGYLFALNRQRERYQKLEDDYQKVFAQLRFLESMGHEIGLHVHPHWEDCFFDGNIWQMNLSRYKLSDFTREEAGHIFRKYYAILQDGLQRKMVSFRAGGWCLEPFDYIRDSMAACGIFIDSTVYNDGYAKTATHSYDFKNYPKTELWRFEVDPSKEDKTGSFLEVPLSSYKIHPLLYWRVLFDTILHKGRKKQLGQGVKPSIREVFTKLLFKTTHAVSIDSVKSSLLHKTYRQKKINREKYFCIIGHPKCFTEDTYSNLEKFIETVVRDGNRISTFSTCFKNNLRLPAIPNRSL